MIFANKPKDKMQKQRKTQNAILCVVSGGLHLSHAGANPSERDSTKNERSSRIAHGYRVTITLANYFDSVCSLHINHQQTE